MTTRLVSILGRSASAAVNNSLSVASGMMFNPITYGFSAIILAAETACDWRKVKNGKMTKIEFRKRLKQNGVGVGGGIIGASGGMALGFWVGTAILPGIGSFIGTFGGAIAGGLMGRKLAIKSIQKVDVMIEQKKLK